MKFIFKEPIVKRKSWTLNSASTKPLLAPEHRTVEAVVVVADVVDVTVEVVAAEESVATVVTAVTVENVVVVAASAR